jgi:hypothetical protein
MEARIYGILDSNNCQIDICLTEKGVKRYATLNNYNKVSYRIGYNVFIIAEKINKKWQRYEKEN